MTVQPARAPPHTSKSGVSKHGGGHRRGRPAAAVHRADRALGGREEGHFGRRSRRLRRGQGQRLRPQDHAHDRAPEEDGDAHAPGAGRDPGDLSPGARAGLSKLYPGAGRAQGAKRSIKKRLDPGLRRGTERQSMAGHSKYKNIMYRKGAQDKKRSALFSKLSREITVAAKMGIPDPE